MIAKQVINMVRDDYEKLGIAGVAEAGDTPTLPVMLPATELHKDSPHNIVKPGDAMLWRHGEKGVLIFRPHERIPMRLTSE